MTYREIRLTSTASSERVVSCVGAQASTVSTYKGRVPNGRRCLSRRLRTVAALCLLFVAAGVLATLQSYAASSRRTLPHFGDSTRVVPSSAPASRSAPGPALKFLTAEQHPLAYWPFTETTPGVVHDWVGGHDGQMSAGVSVGQVAQGPSLSSLGFTGTGEVIIPAAGLAPGTAAATMWMRIAQPTDNGTSTLIDSGGLAVTLFGAQLSVRTCATPDTCETLPIRATVTDGAWHLVAVSVNGQVLSAYVDGALAGTGSSSGTGASPASGQISLGPGLRGNLDQVALFADPLSPGTVASLFTAGACPQMVGQPVADTRASIHQPALPLRTRGRFIVDDAGKRVKFAGVNWYGAEELDRVPAGLQCQPVDAIAAHLVADGYNVVRLLWASDTWLDADKTVPPVAVAANPNMRGLGARAVFDEVIDALARHGLLVILDNHVTRADWCCTGNDGNALWWSGYDPAHPPTWATRSRAGKAALFTYGQNRWLAAWRSVATRYGPHGAHPQPAVVAADLRNEPRDDTLLHVPTRWGGRIPPWQDWPRAATRAGNLVLRSNPSLLIVVEGISYAADLRGVASDPIRLAMPDRLVYSAHDYIATHWEYTHGGMTAAALNTQLGASWGWLLTQNRWYTTPVVVGEFGTCHPDLAWCTSADQAWFAAFTAYLQAGDLDWTYFSVNGTGARGNDEPGTCDTTQRFPGCPEGYGLSDDTWSKDASPPISAVLAGLEPVRQTP